MVPCSEIAQQGPTASSSSRSIPESEGEGEGSTPFHTPSASSEEENTAGMQVIIERGLESDLVSSHANPINAYQYQADGIRNLLFLFYLCYMAGGLG